MVLLDDLVLVRYGASAGFVGKSKYGILANNLFKLNHNRELINSEYLYQLLIGEKFQNYIKMAAFGAAMPALSFTVLNDYYICVPPISLQNQFAEKIKNIEAQKALAKKQAQESEDLFQALLQESFNFN